VDSGDTVGGCWPCGGVLWDPEVVGRAALSLPVCAPLVSVGYGRRCCGSVSGYGP